MAGFERYAGEVDACALPKFADFSSHLPPIRPAPSPSQAFHGPLPFSADRCGHGHLQSLPIPLGALRGKRSARRRRPAAPRRRAESSWCFLAGVDAA